MFVAHDTCHSRTVKVIPEFLDIIPSVHDSSTFFPQIARQKNRLDRKGFSSSVQAVITCEDIVTTEFHLSI